MAKLLTSKVMLSFVDSSGGVELRVSVLKLCGSTLQESRVSALIPSDSTVEDIGRALMRVGEELMREVTCVNY